MSAEAESSVRGEVKARTKSKQKQRFIPPKGPTKIYAITKPWTPVGNTLKVNKTKARIRSITRTLQRQGGEKPLPGHVRIAMERELKSLRSEEAVTRAEDSRRQVMLKDKRIKFFECQKAKRKLNRAKKSLATANDDEKEAAITSHRNADVDYHYANYYPLGTTYVSLYPRKSGDQDVSDDESPESDGLKGDPEMRERIEKAMNEGKNSLQRLKNELVVEEAIEGDSNSKPGPGNKNDPKSQVEKDDDNEEEDDEFFE